MASEDGLVFETNEDFFGGKMALQPASQSTPMDRREVRQGRGINGQFGRTRVVGEGRGRPSV